MIGDIANTVKIMELILKVGLSITDYKLMHGEKRLWIGTSHHQMGKDGSGEKRPGFAISPKLSRDLHIDQLIKKLNSEIRLLFLYLRPLGQPIYE